MRAGLPLEREQMTHHALFRQAGKGGKVIITDSHFRTEANIKINRLTEAAYVLSLADDFGYFRGLGFSGVC
ncbi:hypothetical protein [Hyphobacterium sp.]|uniref:hypothetical protein n=1 Tax=Hyphobacterium sp. TaxID=2004662 RepID=UPI00374A2B9A